MLFADLADNVLIYLDDFIIHSEDMESHKKLVTEVFKRVSKAKMQFNLPHGPPGPPGGRPPDPPGPNQSPPPQPSQQNQQNNHNTLVYSKEIEIYNKISTVNNLDLVKNKIYSTSILIEKCPWCNTKLTPRQFTVNINTVLMNTICKCGLNIEIDPKPTFGVKASLKRKRSDSLSKLIRLRVDTSD